MRYRCEILNHGIDGYEVWLHGRNQGRSGVNGSKSKLLFFKGRYASAITSGIMVNGEIVIYLTMLSIWAITFLQVIVTV